MSKPVITCVKAVFTGLFAMAVMLGADRVARAADDCLAGPNRPPAPGGHWYYHADRTTNRKCWYLVEPTARAPTAEMAEPQPASDAPAPPPFGSFFSALGFTGSTSQPDPIPGDGRMMQTARPNDPRGDESTGRQPRVVRHPVAEASLAAKPHRPAHAQPPAEHADEPTAAAAPKQDERDALFQEFLKWRERQ